MNTTTLRIFLLTSLLATNTWAVQAAENQAYNSLTKELAKKNPDKALLQEMLCGAIESNDQETIELFFKFRDKFDINSFTKDGCNPLIAACVYNNIDLTERLIRHGANVHAGSHLGISVLAAACFSKNSDMVDLIIKNGANIDQPLKDNKSLLTLLAENSGDVEAMQLLIDRGAVINTKGLTPLMCAAGSGQEAAVELLLKHQAEVNALDTDGRSVLMYAIAGKNSKIMELLIQHGANFNAGNSDVCTPLMYGVLCNNSDAIILLIKHGADLDVVDKTGFSALMYAAWLGHSSIVELLIEKGADTSVQAKPRINALTIALHAQTATRQTIKKIVRVILAQNHAAVMQQAYEKLEYNCRLEKPADITILQDVFQELGLAIPPIKVEPIIASTELIGIGAGLFCSGVIYGALGGALVCYLIKR